MLIRLVEINTFIARPTVKLHKEGLVELMPHVLLVILENGLIRILKEIQLLRPKLIK